MRLLLIGIIVAVLAAVVAIVALPRGAEPSAAPSSSAPSSAAELAGSSERYQPYSEQALAAAGPDDTVVLFFSAAWCSTCKVLRDDIAANQQSIPDDVRILVVDYDDSTDLKQQYGVVRQHTLVQIDLDGAGIARWELSRSLDEVLATIVTE
ncbi:thioredoxin family protein [Salinibacterium sp. G-O1]|uniref:thioredoxin family protein n=1 Tax=Salinibacterium sp. G-O1 TaxID=3046208 RepID=UPI0024B955E3|nr:thioredoxin family protein [Salinibacterium sp. G-O1]MDJ0336105.1 thioredoxin family protein [Salinibacterium sp. G-O1]